MNLYLFFLLGALQKIITFLQQYMTDIVDHHTAKTLHEILSTRSARSMVEDSNNNT